MKSSYKVSLKGTQECKAPKPQGSGKKPVVRKGGDLRTKGGK
ncbi:hypothetical protein [Intestinibacillus massiliensis]